MTLEHLGFLIDRERERVVATRTLNSLLDKNEYILQLELVFVIFFYGCRLRLWTFLEGYV